MGGLPCWANIQVLATVMHGSVDFTASTQAPFFIAAFSPGLYNTAVPNASTTSSTLMKGANQLTW